MIEISLKWKLPKYRWHEIKNKKRITLTNDLWRILQKDCRYIQRVQPMINETFSLTEAFIMWKNLHVNMPHHFQHLYLLAFLKHKGFHMNENHNYLHCWKLSIFIPVFVQIFHKHREDPLCLRIAGYFSSCISCWTRVCVCFFNCYKLLMITLRYCEIWR